MLASAVTTEIDWGNEATKAIVIALCGFIALGVMKWVLPRVWGMILDFVLRPIGRNLADHLNDNLADRVKDAMQEGQDEVVARLEILEGHTKELVANGGTSLKDQVTHLGVRVDENEKYTRERFHAIAGGLSTVYGAMDLGTFKLPELKKDEKKDQ